MRSCSSVTQHRLHARAGAGTHTGLWPLTASQLRTVLVPHPARSWAFAFLSGNGTGSSTENQCRQQPAPPVLVPAAGASAETPAQQHLHLPGDVHHVGRPGGSLGGCRGSDPSTQHSAPSPCCRVNGHDSDSGSPTQHSRGHAGGSLGIVCCGPQQPGWRRGTIPGHGRNGGYEKRAPPRLLPRVWPSWDVRPGGHDSSAQRLQLLSSSCRLSESVPLRVRFWLLLLFFWLILIPKIFFHRFF